MKLAIVSPYAPRFLGLGNYLKALLPAFSSTPVFDEVVVLADRHAEPAGQEAPGVRVERAWNADSPAVLRHMLAAVQRERPDVVWYSTSLMLGSSPVANMSRLLAPAATASRGIPTVVTLHNLMDAVAFERLGVPASPVYRRAGRFATAMQFRAHTVCFTLRRYAELARSAYSAANALHVPHHVFGPPGGHQLRRQATRLLCFGLNAPFKGLDVLERAVELSRPEVPGLRLYVAGGVHPRFPAERSAAPRRSGLPVHRLGQVSDAGAQRLMAHADVLVAPNLASSGASSVIHRAVAHGKAIIASDLPDFRALADEEGFAIEFVEPGNARALAEAIRRVCHSAELRARAAEMNLAAAAALTPAAIARAYAGVFQEAAAAVPGREVLQAAPLDLLPA